MNNSREYNQLQQDVFSSNILPRGAGHHLGSLPLHSTPIFGYLPSGTWSRRSSFNTSPTYLNPRNLPATRREVSPDPMDVPMDLSTKPTRDVDGTYHINPIPSPSELSISRIDGEGHQDSHHEPRFVAGAASGRKGRRVRTVFTPRQLERMETQFEGQKYLTGIERHNLASKLNLSEVQIKTWFQNRRIKWKKQILDQRQNTQNSKQELSNRKESNQRRCGSGSGAGHGGTDMSLSSQVDEKKCTM